MTEKKQAIVVIHGIGEQVPMETLREFVHGVWETDTALTDPRTDVNPQEVWSKPDDRTGSLELRRITTRKTKKSDAFPEGIRSDFYELYWADLSGGSTWGHIKAWFLGLLWRDPRTRVPKDVFGAWVALWVATIVVVTLALLAALWSSAPYWCTTLFAVLSAAGAGVTSYVIIPYVGRIVRYTRAYPDNVGARKAIRERGLALFERLHQRQDYERVIVVGHSLGAILAYDLVSYFWAMRRATRTFAPDTDEFKALQGLEIAAAGMDTKADSAAIEAFHTAQRKLCGVLRRRRPPEKDKPNARWLITDLITLGSPLGHAEFLLADSRKDFDDQCAARVFSKNQPLRETLDPDKLKLAQKANLTVGESRQLCCFPDGRDWVLHFAAPFAAVRWTNIYDPARRIFAGDIVSSPAAPVYGAGVIDIDLRALRGQAKCFSHLDYWLTTSPVALARLREALDLAGHRVV